VTPAPAPGIAPSPQPEPANLHPACIREETEDSGQGPAIELGLEPGSGLAATLGEGEPAGIAAGRGTRTANRWRPATLEPDGDPRAGLDMGASQQRSRANDGPRHQIAPWSRPGGTSSTGKVQPQTETITLP
jgi:hypothetical protein